MGRSSIKLRQLAGGDPARGKRRTLPRFVAFGPQAPLVKREDPFNVARELGVTTNTQKFNARIIA
jgi:hypothetical protein